MVWLSGHEGGFVLPTALRRYSQVKGCKVDEKNSELLLPVAALNLFLTGSVASSVIRNEMIRLQLGRSSR